MVELRKRKLREGKTLTGDILKVDGFLNHQLDPALTMSVGRSLHKAFQNCGVTSVSKVATSEVGGIAPALCYWLSLRSAGHLRS
jgi:xanthine phosphoribosyltransferase